MDKGMIAAGLEGMDKREGTRQGWGAEGGRKVRVNGKENKTKNKRIWLKRCREVKNECEHQMCICGGVKSVFVGVRNVCEGGR